VLYEFAMTPDLFDASLVGNDRASGVILVELLRGITENGLLANLHKGQWLRHITTKRMLTLSPALKDRVMVCLSVLHDRHRLVRHPKCMSGDPSCDQDWLSLALDSHQRIPFHGIILSKILMNGCKQQCDAFLEFLVALDSPQWGKKRNRTLTLTKSRRDYKVALSRILRHAKALSLVDAYMNCSESRFFNTIDICSEVMGQRGHARLNGRIYIHAEKEKQKPYGKTLTEYLDAWEHKLKDLAARDGHRFKVFLWESLPGTQTMYDSYILTDQCGVFLHRLDCRIHSHSNSTDWNLLDEETRLHRLEDYDPASSPFQLLGRREVL